MEKTEKTAFLMVGIGSTYQEARRLAMNGMDHRIRAEFPDYEVRQALERLRQEGSTEVIVQPFQIFAGEEYEAIRESVRLHAAESGFGKTEILPCVTMWVKQEPQIIN